MTTTVDTLGIRSGRGGGRSVFRSPWMIFFLFAINGPALSLFGQLRFSELAILILAALNAPFVLRSIGKTEWRLGSLFLLSAVTYLAMDIANQGIDKSTISNFGTYTILCALLFALKWIVGDSKVRLVAALLGYAFSFVVVLIFNLPVPSASYHTIPWRLGLGAAATLLVCTLIFNTPRFYMIGLLVLVAMIVLHLVFNSRNLALLTFIVLWVALWAQLFGRQKAAKLGFRPFARFMGYGTLAAIGLYALMQSIVALSILPDEMQAKFEVQFQNSYGIIAAARPDTATAIHAIIQRPLTGFGSSTVDPEVHAFYARVAAANFITAEEQRFRYFLEQEARHGTPSHSHLFGAWADAGVVAAISWIAVLVICMSAIGRTLRFRHPITPLATFVAVTLLWDVLFSPGPIRLSVTLSLTTLLFVQRLLARSREASAEVLMQKSPHGAPDLHRQA